jgi:hypothetical protein
MEDQIVIAFSGVMDQAMSILVAKEAGSSSTRRSKRRRRYVNRDREAAHLRLRHDYFNDNCVYPRHISTGGTVCLFLNKRSIDSSQRSNQH